MSETMAGRLRALLQSVVDEFAPLMRTIPLKQFKNDPSSGFVVITLVDSFWTNKADPGREDLVWSHPCARDRSAWPREVAAQAVATRRSTSRARDP